MSLMLGYLLGHEQHTSGYTSEEKHGSTSPRTH